MKRGRAVSPPHHSTATPHCGSIWKWTEVVTVGESQMGRPYLLPFLDSPAGADDNFVSSLKSDHLRHAVGGTRVVDVPANTEHLKRWLYGKWWSNLRMTSASGLQFHIELHYSALVSLPTECQQNKMSKKKFTFSPAAMKHSDGWVRLMKKTRAFQRDRLQCWAHRTLIQKARKQKCTSPTQSPGEGMGRAEDGTGLPQSHPPCGTSRQSSVDDVVVVNAEHVHPAVLKQELKTDPCGFSTVINGWNKAAVWVTSRGFSPFIPTGSLGKGTHTSSNGGTLPPATLSWVGRQCLPVQVIFLSHPVPIAWISVLPRIGDL